jgi:hypothetical protein
VIETGEKSVIVTNAADQRPLFGVAEVNDLDHTRISVT